MKPIDRHGEQEVKKPESRKVSISRPYLDG